MMEEKARLFGDKETLEKILEATVQGKIKALGREVKNFDQAEWDKCKHTIVLAGNFQKFLQNPELKDFLLRTGDKILVWKKIKITVSIVPGTCRKATSYRWNIRYHVRT